MKFIGCIFIFLSCSFAGFYKYLSLKKRCSNILEIKHVTENLKTQIGFLKNDLATAFHDASYGYRVFSLYDKCGKNIANHGIDKAWEESLTQYADTLFFTKDDVLVIKKFSKGLGKSDTESELKKLNLISQMADELYNNASKELSEQGKLYKTSGCAVGILLVLLLI